MSNLSRFLSKCDVALRKFLQEDGNNKNKNDCCEIRERKEKVIGILYEENNRIDQTVGQKITSKS